MTPAELKARMDTGVRPLLLDVREDWEHELVALEGTTHIPMADIGSAMTGLERDREIVVYCHTGNRSRMVVTLLERSGFARVHNLEGGIHAWALEIDPELPVY